MATRQARLAAVLVALAVGLGLSFWLEGLGTGGELGPAARGDSPGRPEYRYRRVICMSPAVAEIVFSLGAGERVVGVSQHTKWPPEALAKPNCGGFFNPSYERILALRPDLQRGMGRRLGVHASADPMPDGRLRG